MGTAKRQRTISIKSIYQGIGMKKAVALPRFHADQIEVFYGKGKISCWRALNYSENVQTAFAALGTQDPLSNAVVANIHTFVCQLYCPRTAITDVGELRWWLFSKRQMQDCKLPPTVAALEKHINRANYQAMIWVNDITAMPDLPAPFTHGWKQDPPTNEVKPIRTNKNFITTSTLH